MTESTEKEFYDSVVGDYDRMTAFDQRLETAEKFIGKLERKVNLRHLADVACGTGLYSIAAARQGAVALGLDISPGMIEAAQSNARRHRVADSTSWQVHPMQTPMPECTGKYDVVICMANSIPHIVDRTSLCSVLANFKMMLRSGGMVVIQLLNYRRILDRQERILSADRSGNREYIRFYDFLEDGSLRFNVLRLQWPPGNSAGAAPEYDLQSVILHPYTATEIGNELDSIGFRDIAHYGSPLFTEFNSAESATVMITARGPATA